MDSVDAEEVISEADSEREKRSEHAKEALTWFLDDDRVGEMMPREDAAARLASHLGCSEPDANVVIGELVGDLVDPVQQVMTNGKKYVGVIEYVVYEDAGAYGYVDYDDRFGRRKRVVCARCVEQHELDERISHATQGEGTTPADASWEDLLNRVTAHYADAHEAAPESIEPGASLVSGTTIGGNKAFHAGNDGSGSGLDADTVDGNDSSQLGGGGRVLAKGRKTTLASAAGIRFDSNEGANGNSGFFGGGTDSVIATLDVTVNGNYNVYGRIDIGGSISTTTATDGGFVFRHTASATPGQNVSWQASFTDGQGGVTTGDYTFYTNG